MFCGRVGYQLSTLLLNLKAGVLAISPPKTYRHPSVKEITVVEVDAPEEFASDRPPHLGTDLGIAMTRIVNQDLNELWLESGHPPLIIVNFGETRPSFRRLVFDLYSLHKFVNQRNGRICFCGCNPGPYGNMDFAPNLDEAVKKLLPFRQPIVPDGDAFSNVDIRSIKDVRICLIGCPDRDLGELPGRLIASGLHVAQGESVVDHDCVLFCISCVDGPTAGTHHAVANCKNRTIWPLAIVLTNYALVDDSLRELITLEERELLSNVLPEQTVDELPLLYDFDPSLVFKLASLVSAGPDQITCKV